jgi:hypothetical protein
MFSTCSAYPERCHPLAAMKLIALLRCLMPAPLEATLLPMLMTLQSALQYLKLRPKTPHRVA